MCQIFVWGFQGTPSIFIVTILHSTRAAAVTSSIYVDLHNYQHPSEIRCLDGEVITINDALYGSASYDCFQRR